MKKYNTSVNNQLKSELAKLKSTNGKMESDLMLSKKANRLIERDIQMLQNKLRILEVTQHQKHHSIIRSILQVVVVLLVEKIYSILSYISYILYRQSTMIKSCIVIYWKLILRALQERTRVVYQH